MGKKSTEDDSPDDDNSKKSWSGEPETMDTWEKRTARWCRKKWCTIIGNMIWEDCLPDLDEKNGLIGHCHGVWDSINDNNAAQAKELWTMTLGFWPKK